MHICNGNRYCIRRVASSLDLCHYCITSISTQVVNQTTQVVPGPLSINQSINQSNQSIKSINQSINQIPPFLPSFFLLSFLIRIPKHTYASLGNLAHHSLVVIQYLGSATWLLMLSVHSPGPLPPPTMLRKSVVFKLPGLETVYSISFVSHSMGLTDCVIAFWWLSLIALNLHLS
ncbi:hypothetical protein L211DRAFT_223438 [Terfezia boudieri ATCC MYA-4762]|uniref:Uncharacterized protein n=1 Tax=Terfezia boudieri ATCC MYA-4762 TaxID=1051890 RepID=A0A3N4LLM4_9PEZI|nr:hypothetical protein L211DRAFT_223438 [Terfezia boudieri ATCC MYA-4762]